MEKKTEIIFLELILILYFPEHFTSSVREGSEYTRLLSCLHGSKNQQQLSTKTLNHEKSLA